MGAAGASDESAGGTGPVVTVFGSYKPAADGQADGEAVAEAVGRTLARLGYAVANGGYGGTMAASARGAVEVGGHTIGVTCSFWGAKPNAYIRQVVVTDSLAERLERLASIGSAGFVALPGGTGTLLELAWVWEAMAKKMIPTRPIVCVGDFWRPVVETIAAVRSAHAEVIRVVAGADELAPFFPPQT